MAEIVANCPGPVQQAHFPAFDIGFDEIESIEPECGDDGVEGGQGDNLLRDLSQRSPVYRDGPGQSQGRRDF